MKQNLAVDIAVTNLQTVPLHVDHMHTHAVTDLSCNPGQDALQRVDH